ncbi:protein PIN-LIKES 1-like [Cornus florida]|uniref:protein PIN-LIKES 1-like n=1 Tax=Cornus florida TaxID=4283 RepID=UPI00289CC97C|nr:protein PIN-LIKES 1-like [Cornus florida]
MGLLELFSVASMPVLKVLLVTALGSFLALDHVDILGDDARKHLNRVVYFVFNPALVGSNIARTITLESIALLWFMPLNILITFIIGSALGWLLVKVTRGSQHLKGLIIGSCAAGNLGHLPIIIISAVCREKGSPFGAPEVCYTYGMAYASLSMAIGAIYIWTYVYNIVRLSSIKIIQELDIDDSTSNDESTGETSKTFHGSCAELLLPSKVTLPGAKADGKAKVLILDKAKQFMRMFLRKTNLKALLAPSTTGAIVGFIIGIVPYVRKLLIGGTAPFHVVQGSASLLGNAAIPTVTLIVGGNLLKGFKGSGINLPLIVGIIAVRYLFLPMLGIFIVQGAVHFGLVHSDPLYQFVLLLQYALPPAMNLGTITQLFGAGESECSVILLWAYALASISLTVWSTFFMWLVT